MAQTFALVTPEAVVGGYLDFVLERLQAYGLGVRACCLLEMDTVRLARMYLHRDDPRPWRGVRTELPEGVMAKLYQLSPACLLTVDGPCEVLLRCKGATRPEAAEAGTVRQAGENIIFNFLHCPDDEASAAIELKYLLGAEDAQGMTVAGDVLTGIDSLRLCLPAFTGWEALSFPMVANRLGLRVVARLALRSRDGLPQAYQLLIQERERLATRSSAAQRLHIAQDAHPAIHEALTTAASADPTTMAGLNALAQLYDIAGTRQLKPILALAGRGIYLSELEKVALDAHRHAFWSEDYPPADVSG